MTRRNWTTALTAFVLAVGSASGAASAAAPAVAVTLKPIQSLVAALMAGVGAPVLIVDGAASPHTFTLKPSAARAIAEANIFVRVSPQVEPFTRKVVEGLGRDVTVITLAEDTPGLTLLDLRTSGTFEPHEHHDGDDEDANHHGSRAEASPGSALKDGHLWLDPANAVAIVDRMVRVLSDRDPEHRATFESNAKDLKDKLAALDAEIATQLQGDRGKPFLVFHDAIQYFEHRYGLSAAGAITLSPEQPPSAKRLAEVRQKVTSHSAVCVFAEPGFQPNLVAAVTEGTSARVATIDPEGLNLQPGPALYFELLRGLARDVSQCLAGKSG